MVHDQCDKYEVSDRHDELNFMPAYSEIQEKGFPVLVDWSASNGPQNPVWRSNLEKMSDNCSGRVASTENKPESYEDVLARNEIEMGAAIEDCGVSQRSDGLPVQASRNEVILLPKMTVLNGTYTIKQAQDAIIRWNDLSGPLRLEIFDNLSLRFGKDAARKGLNLDEEQMNDITLMANHYNEENAAEDEAILLMQKDQLNAILRGDHDAGLSRSIQPIFENITDRHLSWIHGGMKGQQHICTQREKDLALRFLRQITLDANLLGEWSESRLAECAHDRDRFKISDACLKLVTKPQDPKSGQSGEHVDSGYVTTDDSSQGLQPQDILQMARSNIKAPKPVGRPRGPKSSLGVSRKRRRLPSPSPLHNELPVSTDLPLTQNKRKRGPSDPSRTSHRPTASEAGAEPPKQVSGSSRKRTSSDVRPSLMHNIPGMRPDTPIEASTPGFLVSGTTRSLRALSELRPSRAALEMEETGLLLKHRGGQLGEDDGESGPDVEEEKEEHNEKPSEKTIVLKLSEAGRAYLRKAKAGMPSQAISKEGRGPGIFAGLSTTLPMTKPHTPRRPPPLLPPKPPMRREVIGWNPPRHPPSFPNPARITKFTHQLLEMDSREENRVGKVEEYLTAARTREQYISGPSPEWSPASGQNIPERRSELTAFGAVNDSHGLAEPPSSPQFAAPINNLLNVPDPDSPLLSRTESLSNLLTPTTSPAKRTEDREMPMSSSSEESDSTDPIIAKPSPTKGIVEKTPPSMNANTRKRPYNKRSPYWENRSAATKTLASTLQEAQSVQNVPVQLQGSKLLQATQHLQPHVPVRNIRRPPLPPQNAGSGRAIMTKRSRSE